MKVRGCRVQSHELDITNPQRGKLVQQSYRFEAGPTACKMSKGDRSVTLERSEEFALGGRPSLHDG